MIDRLLSIIAPHDCVRCGHEGSLLCADCVTRLPQPLPRCYRCQKVSGGWRTCSSCLSSSRLSQVRAATSYKDAAKALVWKLKFERAQAASEEIAKILAPAVAISGKFYVVPVPTAQSRVRQRGYDQALLIAKQVAKLVPDAMYYPLLQRTGNVRQVGQSRQHRFQQIKHSFRATIPLSGRPRILLIDDVITTGATLESAARVLKDAGAGKIEALVFAQA